MIPVRPTPSWEAPPGTVHEPAVDTDWRLVVVDRRCRLMQARKACGKPAVAELNRARHGMPENWWAYCPGHMFGRWVEDGQVWQWRAVPVKAEDLPALPEGQRFAGALHDLVNRVNGFVYAGDRFNAVVDAVRHLRADPALAATLLHSGGDVERANRLAGHILPNEGLTPEAEAGTR